MSFTEGDTSGLEQFQLINLQQQFVVHYNSVLLFTMNTAIDKNINGHNCVAKGFYFKALKSVVL